MFDFLRDLFFPKKTPTFPMGLLESPADSRNIPLTAVQKPVTIPDSYISDFSALGVNYQNGPTCVGNSVAKMAEYYVLKNTGKVIKIDPDKLYAQCKLEDGRPNDPGTYPQVALKIAIRDGVDQMGTDSNDKFATGYAFVDVEFESVCQALYQNGVATIGGYIDLNWYLGIIGRILKGLGGHQTTLIGYDKTQGKVFGLNSWGTGWIGRIAGSLDDRVKPGFYEAKFSDIGRSTINIMVVVPIPKPILDDVKNTAYRFTSNMRIGAQSLEVLKLQEVLGVVPKTGYFGSLTENKVKAYQIAHGLTPDGIVGPVMRDVLNKGTKSFIPQWIAAIKQMEGALPSRNNPGNLRFVGQPYAINDRGFCKFDTYEHGYQALESLLIRACTGKSKYYHPAMTLHQFYQVYAPDSDGNNSKAYATFVAKKLGVSISTQIKDLL